MVLSWDRYRHRHQGKTTTWRETRHSARPAAWLTISPAKAEGYGQEKIMKTYRGDKEVVSERRRILWMVDDDPCDFGGRQKKGESKITDVKQRSNPDLRALHPTTQEKCKESEAQFCTTRFDNRKG